MYTQRMTYTHSFYTRLWTATQQAGSTSVVNLIFELQHVFCNVIFLKTYKEVPDVCSVVL